MDLSKQLKWVFKMRSPRDFTDILTPQQTATSAPQSVTNHHPHRSSVLHPYLKFFVGGEWLYLYTLDGTTPSTSFCLYWDHELNPAEHLMTSADVLHFLAYNLKRFSRFIELDSKASERNGWTCEAHPNCKNLARYLALSAEESKKIKEGRITSLEPPEIGEQVAKYLYDFKLGTRICNNCRQEL